MKIRLYPVICWLTSDSNLNYGDSYAEIVCLVKETANRRAEYCNAVGVEASFGGLIDFALHKLQHRILDQYLPELKDSEVKAVGAVWPWWRSVKIILPNGQLLPLRPLPSNDGKEYMLSPEKGGHKFTFYSNSDREQRLRWLLSAIKEEANRQIKNERRRQSYHSDRQVGDPDLDPRARKIDLELAIDRNKLFEITDPADWNLARSRGRDVPPAEDGTLRRKTVDKIRQARHRAKERILAAGALLIRNDDRAVALRAQLKASPNKKRHRILNALFRSMNRRSKSK